MQPSDIEHAPEDTSHRMFIKKPVIIEAVQLCWATWNDVCAFLGEIINEDNPARMVDTYSDACGESGPEYIELTIPTRDGDMVAQHGDWIIREPVPTEDRKFYPCKPDIFEATYNRFLGNTQLSNEACWAVLEDLRREWIDACDHGRGTPGIRQAADFLTAVQNHFATEVGRERLANSWYAAQA